MKKVKAKIAGLVLAAALVFGVTVSLSDNGNGTGQLKDSGTLFQGMGSIVGQVQSLEVTMSQLADAAKQLDATTQSGGPTAAQNQKIQELTFNLQEIQQTLNRATN